MAAAAGGAWDCGLDEPLYPGRGSKFTSWASEYWWGFVCWRICSNSSTGEFPCKKKKKVQWYFTQLVLVTFHMTRKVIDCLFKGALHHLSLSCGEKLHASLRLFFVTPPCFAFLQVCRKLGIIEVDYFGLQFTGSKGENLWLNLRNRISQQMDNLTPCRLRLRVKFFVEPHLILQEQTRYFWKFARCKDTVCKEICS